jgi:hypothetical protein
MTDIALLLFATLPLVLIMALTGPSPAADSNEERARKSLRSALGGLVSAGLTKARVARLAADELHELRLLRKGAS